MATIVNPAGLSPVVFTNPGAGKDSRWLTLEVCREFARSKCSRNDEECKYAHPPPHVEIQNGRVTCCFDSIKGKCQRKEPPCKYLHPPQHLKEILLQNGRQNLIIKNLQMQATLTSGLQPIVQMPPNMFPLVYEPNTAHAKPVVQSQYPSMVVPGQYLAMLPPGSSHPYLVQSAMPSYPYFTPTMAGFPTGIFSTIDSNGASVRQIISSSDSISQSSDQRNIAKQMETWNVGNLPNGYGYSYPIQGFTHDSLACSQSQGSSSSTVSTSTANQPRVGGQGQMPSWDDSSNTVTSVATTIDSSPYFQPVYYKRQVVEVLSSGPPGVVGRKRLHDPGSDLIMGINGVPGMVPVMKRPALVDFKSGLPVYRHMSAAASYQQAALAMQLQPQFVPISIAGPTSIMPRY